MAKPIFKYNPKALTFERQRYNLRVFIRRFLPGILISAGTGFLFFLLFITFLETPDEKRLKHEKAVLSSNLEQINDSLRFYDTNLDAIAKHDNHQYRVIAEMDSIPARVRTAGYGGSRRYKKLAGREHSDLVIDVLSKLDLINKRIHVQNMSFVELSKALEAESERLRRLPVVTPVHNSDLTRLGSNYGYRVNPITGGIHFHKGIDLTAPYGKPVYAPGAGTVTFAGNRHNGYGNYIIIDHGINGITSLYGHLSSINVKKGQKVVRGEMIGKIGNTGLSTAPHLHYEIRINGKPVNPANYRMPVEAGQYDQLVRNAEKSKDHS
jgi:murein DD-endopeptidase MepM/ murein hydrolase activator NlpD